MFQRDRSDERVFAIGQAVRFKDSYLLKRPETAKRFSGRVGQVTGYRLGAADPIVNFPKDGRRKEQKLFEVANNAIELSPQESSPS